MASEDNDIFEQAKVRAKEIGNRLDAISRLRLVPRQNRAMVYKAINEVYPVKEEVEGFTPGLGPGVSDSPARQFLGHILLTGGGAIAGGLAGALLGPAGVVPGEMAGGAGGEKLAQELGFAERDPMQVVLAGLASPVGRGVVRLARGIGRTATRLIPSLFQRAQRGAIEAADDLARALAPEESATALFGSVRAAGAEPVKAAPLRTVLADLEKSIPKDPATPGLKIVREFMGRFENVIKGQSVDLGEMMKLRLDLGRSMATRGGANELGALYSGVLQSLEESAKQGGKGAATSLAALNMFKKDLGVIRFKEILESPKVSGELTLGAGKALNIRALSREVAKNRKELGKLLGDGGLNLIDAFIDKYRGLPPETAMNFANFFTMLMGAGAGVYGAGPVGLTVGLAPEMVKNVFAVGANPAAAGRIATVLAQTARVGLLQEMELAGPDVTP